MHVSVMDRTRHCERKLEHTQTHGRTHGRTNGAITIWLKTRFGAIKGKGFRIIGPVMAPNQ